METNKLTHHDLDLWKESIQFVADIYRISCNFPSEEKYALTSQIKRAAVSICSNIAEGAARGHKKEFIQFLFISLGSISEVETHLEIAIKLGFIKSAESEIEKIKRIKQMIRGLIRYLRK